MPIKNYTTKISVDSTVADIQQHLAKAGAVEVSVRYDQGRPVAVRFHLEIGGPSQLVPFVIVPNVEGCQAALKKDGVEPRFRTPDRAEKVAWRLALNWIDVQIAFVMAHQAQHLAQLFLGIGLVQTDNDAGVPVWKTLFQVLIEDDEVRGRLLPPHM